MSISVCIATYNGALFIERQLSSILIQLSVDDEVIISDDNSVDSTCQIINSLQDPRIRLLKNTHKSGPVGNFENALRTALGNIIFLADQDDEWLPGKVNETIALLEDYDLVLSDCQVVDKKGKLIYESFFHYRNSKPGFWRNLYKNSYNGCCMAFRRDVLDYALPFPSAIHMHDWWIGLLVEAKGRTYFYNKPLINYTRHGSNASPTSEEGYSFQVKIVNRLLLFVSVAKRLWG
ncbi:glycosyltransferase family 2 protein [Spirosoma fluviale]|uniref:Glycosyl transferase family 2 n=1 Tax=Spirosoma fluviale TaxID=1597977 RepID=A0A286GHT6_9BACT|nr:glycosyltransferase family 2 protein [Spirosoma fluviale]SOD95078.1 Glycosyl transferase family 2 [Spirosoma fluviale]